ncbi:hypothetical protein [Rhodocyclus tenuis]|uniref:Uncharacterized protein n=1 Tax=Rhodocyclus tenuis TaxID=1066 RepID=A0A840G5V1_RHOTE|nr:hypothetical protein [Rhodocyclus tenuis]MBB4246350.1 hypothetical protein [Rhodocyclus tenuis]
MPKELDKIDTDTATLTGQWWGAGGFFIGFIGIGITLYFAFAQKPEIFWLTFSGWMAALLSGICLGYVGYRLVKLAAIQGVKIEDLTGELERVKAENSRLTHIADYVVSVRQRAKSPSSRKAAQSTEHPAERPEQVETAE